MSARIALLALSLAGCSLLIGDRRTDEDDGGAPDAPLADSAIVDVSPAGMDDGESADLNNLLDDLRKPLDDLGAPDLARPPSSDLALPPSADLKTPGDAALDLTSASLADLRAPTADATTIALADLATPDLATPDLAQPDLIAPDLLPAFPGPTACNVIGRVQLSAIGQPQASMQAGDVAAIGSGNFAVTFYGTTTGTGFVYGMTVSKALAIVAAASPLVGCVNAPCSVLRVAPALSTDTALYFTSQYNNGQMTQLTPTDRSAQHAGYITDNCPANNGGGSGVARSGTTMAVVESCGANGVRGFAATGAGHLLIAPGSAPREARVVASSGAAYLSWLDAGGAVWAAPLDLGSISLGGGAVTVASTSLSSPGGLGFGVVTVGGVSRSLSAFVVYDSSNTRVLAYGAGPIDGSAATYTTKDKVTTYVGYGPAAPVGVAAGPGWFLTTWTDASFPPVANAKAVLASGDVAIDTFPLSANGAAGWVPQAAYDADSNTFGVVYFDGTGSTVYPWFATLSCQ